MHAYVRKRAPSRTTWRWPLNDIVRRVFLSVGIPAVKEPSGLIRTEAKRPAGQIQISWRGGWSVIWYVTVACSLADSYVEITTREARAVAEHAAAYRVQKYSSLPASYSLHCVGDLTNVFLHSRRNSNFKSTTYIVTISVFRFRHQK